MGIIFFHSMARFYLAIALLISIQSIGWAGMIYSTDRIETPSLDVDITDDAQWVTPNSNDEFVPKVLFAPGLFSLDQGSSQRGASIVVVGFLLTFAGFLGPDCFERVAIKSCESPSNPVLDLAFKPS